MWVTALGIFPVVAALVGWFGIRVWLGHGAQLAAATAALLVIGTAPLLFNSIVDVTAKVVGDARDRVMVSWHRRGRKRGVHDSACSPIGVIGVPLGTAIGQVISFFVCIYLARKKIGKQITPFFWYISYVPTLVAVAVAGVCEWSLRNSLPGWRHWLRIERAADCARISHLLRLGIPRAFAEEVRNSRRSLKDASEESTIDADVSGSPPQGSPGTALVRRPAGVR